MTSTAGEIKIDQPGRNQRKLVGSVVSDKRAKTILNEKKRGAAK